MKFKIIGFEEEIQFKNDKVNILEIENVKLFANIIEIFNNNINGIDTNEIVLLNEDNKQINIAKQTYMTFDLFNINYNDKNILSKIYDIISNNIKENQEFEIGEAFSKLRRYLVEEINELPFEFIMKDEPEIVDILKVFNLKIDEVNYSTILNRIEILIDLLSILKIADILIIPNLKMYLNEEELVELYKYSLYNNIKLLIIGRKISNNKLQYEDIYKIDSQFDEMKI